MHEETHAASWLKVLISRLRRAVKRSHAQVRSFPSPGAQNRTARARMQLGAGKERETEPMEKGVRAGAAWRGGVGDFACVRARVRDCDLAIVIEMRAADRRFSASASSLCHAALQGASIIASIYRQLIMIDFLIEILLRRGPRACVCTRAG